MTMVPRARGPMDMGVGYNEQFYRHVGETSCVNQHIFNSEMKNKKVGLIFKCTILHFGGIVVRLKKIFSLRTGHHGHLCQ